MEALHTSLYSTMCIRTQYLKTSGPNYHSANMNTLPWQYIKDALATIGGLDCQEVVTSTLLSLSGSSWEEVLPPMPTKRVLPAAANTPTHLVVAGGTQSLLEDPKATVEVLNTETLQWSTASSLPKAVGYPQMTTCDGCMYLSSRDNNAFSCSVEDLLKSTNNSGGGSAWTRLVHALKSTNSSNGGSVWTRLAIVDASWYSGLATLRGCVLAIGGADDMFGHNPTGTIQCYDVVTNTWSVMGEMPTPRYKVLTAVLPSNELVVVGGSPAVTTEIGSCQ